MKKKLVALTVVLALGTTATAFAASAYNTPAEVVAGITGRTIQSIVDERYDTGKTYGTIANEAGKLDEFKKESLEMKKDNLQAQVDSGRITKADADAIIKAIEENQVNCDGTGTAGIGAGMGAKFGSNGTGLGTRGANRGSGMGRAGGSGAGVNRFSNIN